MKRLFITFLLLIVTSIPAPCGQRYIRFDAQQGGWTATNALAGSTSKVTSTIKAIKDDGTTGVLELTQVSGVFQDNEITFESAFGAELISSADNRDFSGGDLGNWIVHKDGTGTILYDAVNPGAEEVAKLTAAGDCSYFRGYLETWLMAALPANGFLQVKFDWYNESANVRDDIHARWLGVSATIPNDITYSNQEKGKWIEYTQAYLMGAAVAGAYTMGCYSAPTAGDIFYFDNISVKQITNAAFVNGAPYGGGRASW